jgi:hypothetical protein
VNILRLLTILWMAVNLSGCSWFNKGSTSSARMYDGDESPNIQMYDENPGSPLRN